MESSPFYFHLSRDLLYTTDWSALNSFIRLCLVEQNIRVGKIKQESPLRQRRQAMSGLLLFNYRRGMMMGKKKGCIFPHFSFLFYITRPLNKCLLIGLFTVTGCVIGSAGTGIGRRNDDDRLSSHVRIYHHTRYGENRRVTSEKKRNNRLKW